MVIEYLYLSLKYKIAALLLPLYLLSHIFLSLQISRNDEYTKDIWEYHRKDGIVEGSHAHSDLKDKIDNMITFNAIAVGIQFI